MLVSANPTTTTTATDGDGFFAVGSGGYADFIFRYAAKELFGVHIESSAVIWRPVIDNNKSSKDHHLQQQGATLQVSARIRKRRRDYYEAVLCRSRETGAHYYHHVPSSSCDADGSVVVAEPGDVVVLRFAVAYGMQTVQRVLSDVAVTGASPYDYVEAMACPGSCLNGGGQLRVADRETPTETRLRVESTKRHFHRAAPLLLLLQSAANTRSSSSAAMHTRYHVVPPMQHSLGAAAGVAVLDTVW